MLVLLKYAKEILCLLTRSVTIQAAVTQLHWLRPLNERVQSRNQSDVFALCLKDDLAWSVAECDFHFFTLPGLLKAAAPCLRKMSLCWLPADLHVRSHASRRAFRFFSRFACFTLFLL